MLKSVIVIKDDHGFQLNPLKATDSKWLLELRNDPKISKFINPTDHTVESHAAWIEANALKEDDYYFAITDSKGEPHGAVALYCIKDGNAEWGRWVIKPGSLAAPNSVCLMLLAAEKLGLKIVYSKTLTKNESVCRFHDAMGAKLEGFFKDHVNIRGVTHDVTWHSIAIGQDSKKIINNLNKFKPKQAE